MTDTNDIVQRLRHPYGLPEGLPTLNKAADLIEQQANTIKDQSQLLASWHKRIAELEAKLDNYRNGLPENYDNEFGPVTLEDKE